MERTIDPTSARPRTAIVGTGGISRSHARALTGDGRPELVAAVDVDPDRLAEFCAEWSVPGQYSSLEEMLERERPEIVHLCTPPGAHTDAAVQSLRAGAAVVCEKPPCLSLADCDRIAAAEAESGRPFVTIFQHRFGSAGRYVHQLIDDGALGRPLVAICNTLWYRPPKYYEPEWRGRWATEGGGPTMGHGIHQIDLLAHLLGDWEQITATAARLDRDVETEDVSFAHIEFANGAIASVVNSVLSPREESYLRFDFTQATVEVTHLYGYTAESWRYTPLPGIEPVVWPPPGEDVRSAHAAQVPLVLDALIAGRQPDPALPTVRRTMEILTAIYASAFTDKRVKREDLVPGHPFYDSLAGELESVS